MIISSIEDSHKYLICPVWTEQQHCWMAYFSLVQTNQLWWMIISGICTAEGRQITEKEKTKLAGRVQDITD